MSALIKLRIRNLSNTEHIIEIEPTATVTDLKKKVADVFSNMNPEPGRQRLIRRGTVLQDSQIVGELPNILTENFLVAMSLAAITGKTATAASTAEVPTAVPPVTVTPSTSEKTQTPVEASPSTGAAIDPAPTSAGESGTGTAPVAAVAEGDGSGGDTAPAPSTETQGAAPGASAPSAMQSTFGQELEQMVQEIMAMGFGDEETRQAFRAAYNCPARAVEYLLNGIPAGPPPSSTDADGGSSTDEAMVAGEERDRDREREETGGNLGTYEALTDMTAIARVEELARNGNVEALRSDPTVERIRSLIRQAGPDTLPHILATIGRAYPTLAQLTSTHPHLLLDLIAPTDEGNSDSGSVGAMEMGGENGFTGLPTLSENDVQAVRRLEGLGFPAAIAVQAYIACERDEEAAANYLFDNQADFELDDNNEGGGGGGAA